ncbi:PAQR family membrane homeostasis protein TrhA [Telmatospirillum sp.]|uniref:PAQR family membrane homeostasis protein TrhA n=1 Tax=Telmatospirillum sp. TaxID=2079197 RepID=UPI00283CF3D9|nr:hemolysin III family protein [Telmatospirillum sp.]MDR3436896.1 hemolysin III family protein [Telmatospirillum sp.]
MVSRYELVADVSVQGAGLAASVVGVGVLTYLTVAWADGIAMAAVLTYGITLIAMFVSSLLNATVRHPLVRLIDHAVIYLLIAGTYTPVCLMVIGGERGVTLLIGVWLAALLGVVIRVLSHRRLKSAIITLYVLMGWCGLIHIDVILQRLHIGALVLLAVGGILYTFGAPLHRWSGLRFHSAIWHGCVLAAAACHYSAILLILSAFHGQASI